MGTMLEHLTGLIEEAAATLPGVFQRRAFGSYGFFVQVDGAEKPPIFALAYSREDRIGVKLTLPADFEALLALPGATVWAPHGSPMSSWVLVPETFHDDLDALRPWVKKAHAQALSTPTQRKPGPKKPSGRRK